MGAAKVDTSGITPFALVAVCAGIGAAFILAVAVAFICKAVNRPSEEAMPYLINGRGALYQPSAAGYGARQGAGGPAGAGAAGGKGGKTAPAAAGGGKAQLSRTPSHASNSRTNLLGAAQPMGRDDSFTRSFDGHNNGGSTPERTHNRGTSTSISQHPYPAAPMAARRPGFGPAGGHPTLPGQIIAPDGSGFTPGQPFRSPNGSTSPGAMPYSSGGGPGPGGSPSFLNVNPNPSMDLARPSRDNKRMSMVSMAHGPPPATAETNRQSRKIDSVGPGVLRKSMFLAADAQFPGLEALQRSGSNQHYPPQQQQQQPQMQQGNYMQGNGDGGGGMTGQDGDPLHMRLPPLQFGRAPAAGMSNGGGGMAMSTGIGMGGNGGPMYRQDQSGMRGGDGGAVQLDTSNFGRGF
ncbi:unnamed protein product [Tilletia controversa]|nr:unnamed protein product [Tilletia controversa]